MCLPARASKSLSGYRVVTPDGLNSSLRRHYDLVGVLPSGSGTPESPSDIVVWRRPPGFFQTSQASHVVRMVRDALHLAKFIHETQASHVVRMIRDALHLAKFIHEVYS